MTENSPNAASTAETAPPKRTMTGRIILAAIMLLLIGFVCFICYTEAGNNFFGQSIVFFEALIAGGSPEKEKAAAETIESLNFMVIREGQDKQVTSISSQGKTIDKKVFEVLPDLFRIGTVNVTDTDITDEQLKSVGKLRKLTSLLLGGTAVTDAGLANLRNLGELESLHLQNTKITDAGLAHLVALPKLTILDISGTKVTDAGMKELAKCQKLNWLLMSKTSISDEGIKAFEKHPRLGRLTIFDTKISTAAIDKLLESIPKLSVDSGATPQGSPAGNTESEKSPDQKSDEEKSEKSDSQSDDAKPAAKG
jgi:Leucine-rich repeat (LRR) protein